MNGFSKYYQKDRQTRLDILVQQKKLTQAEVDSLIAPKLDLTLGDTMIETLSRSIRSRKAWR